MAWNIFSAISTFAGEKALRAFKGRAFVIDGDTMRIKGTRIRLFGMDAPEMDQSQGPAAKSALMRLVRGRTLLVKPIELDRYGRTVARVFREDGRDLGQMMVEHGFARAMLRYSQIYAHAQTVARLRAAGFWRGGEVQNGADHREAD